MNINLDMKSNYKILSRWRGQKTKPIQSQFKPNLTQNKPNLSQFQSQTKPICPGSQAPGAAHRASEHSVGLFTIYKLFLFRIPTELSLERHGDITKVADSDGAVADFDRSCCFAMSLNAINEIAMMVVTLIKVDFVWTNHGSFQRFRAVREFIFLDLNPAVGSLETQRTVRLSSANQLDAISVPGPKMYLCSRGKKAVLRELTAKVFDFNRSGMV